MTENPCSCVHAPEQHVPVAGCGVYGCPCLATPVQMLEWHKARTAPAAEPTEADFRAIRALQGAPLDGCGDDDCTDCYPQ